MTLTAAMAGARFFAFASAMALFGALLFGVYAPPPARDAAHSRLAPARRACAVVMLLSVLAWTFTLAAKFSGGGVGESLNTAAIMLVHAGFGRVLLAALLVDSILLALALLQRRALFTQFLLTGLSVSLLSAIGHGGTAEGAARAGEIAIGSAHLLAGGAWLGGALALSAALPRLEKSDALQTLRAFSRTGYVAVAAVIATGVLNTIAITGEPLPDPGTAYGRLLAVKIAFVAGLLGLAVFNRLANSRPPRFGVLQLSIKAELALFAAIILTVSIFGLMAPQ